MGGKHDSVYPSSEPKVNSLPPPLGQGAPYMPTYFYNYPGQGGTFGQADDNAHFNASGGSYTPENATPLYYPHGYVPYTTGFYDSSYSAADGSAESYGYFNASMMGPNAYGPNTEATLLDKSQALPYSPMVHNPRANLTEPMYHNLPPSASNKLDLGFQPSNLVKGHNQAPQFPSFADKKTNLSMQYGPKNYQRWNDRTWNSYNNYNQRARQSFARNNAADGGLTEMARGPRSEMKNPPKNKEDTEEPWAAIQRDAYNLQDFKTEYDDAKFFVIKSFSEDDVQRSLKYNVWSSTPKGNNKLDATFREAEAKASETGQECPIFLFFSVNGSGQFLGVAEMKGKVDFTKNMDFWQVDKWSGFFPVKWHIIKDVPNKDLKHIILENNENKAVTQSRDTQEIGLKQGLEMLSIFKNYSEESSLISDFDFYEKREKEIKANKSAKTASSLGNANQNAGDTEDSFSTLASLTKNLSLCS